jgi:hypothetical protein
MSGDLFESLQRWPKVTAPKVCFLAGVGLDLKKC